MPFANCLDVATYGKEENNDHTKHSGEDPTNREPSLVSRLLNNHSIKAV